ncbi:carbohydrate-binding protein [Nocardiopsis ganjiahuensis]|uniref:hypothetical protein n=1 Tax=Nocardiopsis ganjiahuensis TaxID=239984 RepID=UPI00034CAF1C|nr:hypothetical protein [Nocardiopsis ganjiahuensis]
MAPPGQPPLSDVFAAAPADPVAAVPASVLADPRPRPANDEAAVTDPADQQLTIDLATGTGGFHGGACGLLYGLYGPGLPTDNLIEGMNVRTVATKGQDGAQHPGSDALEVLPCLVETTGGDVYVRTTDHYRGFPYQWPGETPEERLSGYTEVLGAQLRQIRGLDPALLDHLVIEPFNEPEGNMFGDGEWSYDGTSWLDDPADYFRAWDDAHALIRAELGGVRVSGPNTSILFDQVQGFLQHTVEAGTVPDVVTWHELSHPGRIRGSVERYRAWEAEAFAGTPYEGTELPVNINEYAFNHHTSVPGQMIHWMSAIEESKVDAMIAFWNVNGNLSDSAVQANRANGQWWLYNAYGAMTGHTVRVTPPRPGEDYTLQAVAALDEERTLARALLGGSDGAARVVFDHVPEELFGSRVHAWVREIPWTGQIGDSAPPRLLTEEVLRVQDGAVTVDFGDGLPALTESSAYEIVLTPAGDGSPAGEPPHRWQGSFEAEDAEYTGGGYSLNGPEGSPEDVSKYYTSGGYHVGGLRTGSDGVLDFTVTVPEAGTYDLSVFANSPYTHDLVAEQGPTNVFLRVDGGAEQELFLPLAYNRVVWDHADTTVELREGENTVTLATRSLVGDGATRGEATIDRITLALPQGTPTTTYEAETAALSGATPLYRDERLQGRDVTGSGAVEIGEGDSVTFWTHSAHDAEAVLDVRLIGSGAADLAVNGRTATRVTEDASSAAVSLSGGVNKVTVTGAEGTPLVDRLDLTPSDGHLAATPYQAQDARTGGDAAVVDLPLAGGGQAVDGIGGEPGNGNTLTFDVEAPKAGPYVLRVRYSNPETSESSHYNPNPVARRADISVNGADPDRVLFPPTYHANNFWVLSVPVELSAGANTVTFASEEAPGFDGETYASQTWPGRLLRSSYAPVIDSITVCEFATGL